MIYKNTILSKLESGRSALTDVRCIMIQSTGDIGDTATAFYDNLKDKPSKQYAHYVIDATEIAQYNYLDSSVFIDAVQFTTKANELLTDKTKLGDSPAYHTLVIEVIASNDYSAVEKNLIKFLSELFVKYNVSTDILWRRGDVVDNVSNPAQYATLQNWNAFISCVNTYIAELKSETPNPDNIPTSGVIIPTEEPVWEEDARVNLASYKIDVKELSEEDYNITLQGDIETRQDKFTGYVAIVNGDKYEPVYPDLTVPPASSTLLYDKPVEDIKKIKDETKPVMGKIVNNQDPYPVDEKIIELEQHYPKIKLEDSTLNEMGNGAIANYLVTLSQRTERRIAQLENITSTVMRYLYRLGSRMNINCVYYGGQSQFGKYNCIRCMQDDLVNDGQIVTLDQCLNCARFEPIIGQFYEILDENFKPSLAPILDDLQAARMQKEDYIKLTRVEEMVDEEENAVCDQEALKTKDPDDKTFTEVMVKAESHVMNWTETELETQRPDINLYEYDANKFISQKEELLKPENRYNDNYDHMKKKQVSSSPSTFTGGNIIQGQFDINDYDFTGAETRYSIIQTAKDLVSYAAQEKVLYVFGGKVIEENMNKTPAELISMLPYEQPCLTSVNPLYTDALSLDCSGFTRYCYKHNGVNIPDGADNQMRSVQVVGEIKNFDKSLNEAVPGDLVFYSSDGIEVSHVALYVGGGKMAHSASAKKPRNSQVLIANVYKENFYSIGRHSSLAMPKLKAVRYLDLDITLDQAAKIQLPLSTGYGGGDYDPTSLEEVMNYMNPTNYSGGNYKYQFLHLGMYYGTTVEQIASFLTRIGAAKALIDNADAFIEGSKLYGVSEVYLAAHSCLETGKGTSNLANGSMIGPSGKTIYNMYGIAAYNSDPERIAAKKKADDEGWYTVRDAIIGGAKFVAEGYISKGQNTLYKMRWNPLKPGTHQYATDVGWAVKQTSSIAEVLSNFSDEAKSKFIYEIPVYKS